MNDLRLFVLERLIEREALACAATEGPWEHIENIGWEVDGEPHAHEVVTSREHPTLGVTVTGPYGDRQSRVDARFIAANNPATALRRIRGQIAMLTPHRRVEVEVLRLMAWEFSDHPAYRPEWASGNVLASL
jgi:hypothetical protein